MHELAICLAVHRQVMAIARGNKARVGRITLRIGPLAGVETGRLSRAFPLVAAGTACDGATLHVEHAPVEIRCRMCGFVARTRPNRLVCDHCGTWRVELVSGDEMELVRIEFLDTPPQTGAP